MKVSLERYTVAPMDLIESAAGMCYGREDFVNYDRVRRCYEKGHMSVFEHAAMTWSIHGISRACSHQLVRHRMASYSQRSQRYTVVNPAYDDWYVVPSPLLVDPGENRSENLSVYSEAMAHAAKCYEMLLDNGVNPEDARYVLPSACATNICVTMNLREFYHFLDLRTASGAQAEIKALAWEMYLSLEHLGGDWQALMKLWSDRRDDTPTDIPNEDPAEKPQSKGTLFVMAGCPASGKTTLAETVAANSCGKIEVISSDKIREEWGVDGGDANAHGDVFSEMYERARKALSEGHDVFLDSTMCRRCYRKKALKELRGYCSEAVCVTSMESVTFKECLDRNARRGNPVPEHVIGKMWSQYFREPPSTDEGFDAVLDGAEWLETI